MVKVLFVNGGIMDRGGVSIYMMNIFRHIDKTRFHIDFLVHGDEEGTFDKEIVESGSKIFHVTSRSRNYFKNKKELNEFFKNNSYDIVHSQADSGNANILKFARKHKVKVRISHSHNTSYTISSNGIKNKIRIIYNNLQKKQIIKYATYMCGCSKKAFTWLHGNSQPVNVMNNAIEYDKFCFEPEKRAQIRDKYNIGDSILLGNVGRLDYQKNQQFLLEVIKELNKKCKRYKLMIVGGGKLRESIMERANNLGVSKEIILTGQVDNVSDYYNAFDIFVMPSLFEGLPITVVEAQANGLKCLLSNNITDEVKIGDGVSFLGLFNDCWVKAIKAVSTNNRKCDINSKYDIENETKRVEKIYEELIK